MAVSDWDTVASNNTDVGGISIAEGMNPGNVNDAIREMMAQIATLLPTLERADADSTVTANRAFTGDVDLTGANVSGIYGGAPLYTWSGQTFVDFTNIPAWPSQILLNFRNFSMSAANAAIAIRVGDEDGLKVTDYSGDFGRLDESESYTHNPATTNFAVGFLSPAQTNGTLLLDRTAPQENSWTVIAALGNPGSDRQFITTGSVFLPKPLTQIRVFPSSGTGDSGTLGVSWRR